MTATPLRAAPDTLEALKADIAAKPDGVVEEFARRHGVSNATVLSLLPPEAARAADGSQFDAVWEDLTAWGPIMFIVHTADGVFETKGALPPGTHGRGYFNIHGDSPIGGHIRKDRCSTIAFVDRGFHGRRSCSVWFMNADGGAMFKVFVRRDADRALIGEQLQRFEELRARIAATA